MEIHVKQSCTDSKSVATEANVSDQELKAQLLKLLQERGEDVDSLKWVNDSILEISNVSPLTLHSFALKAEALGKSVCYHKQTIIEIH